MSEKASIKDLSFEKALGELEDIVRKLESGDIELDASIKLYSKGVELKNHCDEILANAKLKVEKIIASEGGKITTEDFS